MGRGPASGLFFESSAGIIIEVSVFGPRWKSKGYLIYRDLNKGGIFNCAIKEP